MFGSGQKASRRRIAVRYLSAALCLVGLGVSAIAQEQEPQRPGRPPSAFERAGRSLRDAMKRMTVPKSRLTDGPYVRAAFRAAVAGPSQATVRVLSKGRAVAVGGIVGPNGWILTKASQLDESVTVQLKDGRKLDANVVGINEAFDLAMLKIEATGLPVLDLARDTPPYVGQWVATPGVGRDPLAVGVVSVDSRAIPKRSGILGVLLGEDDAGPRVDRVVPNSGAANAGILVNDIIMSVNGQSVENRASLIEAIRKHGPDEQVVLGIVRGEEALTLEATLSSRIEGMRPDRGAMQNHFGSRLSRRRQGFPAALQHDTVLRPIDCGGPLVDLDGRTIGFNIARGGRTESYAIPTPVVITLLYDLMSGNLAPPKPAAPPEPASASAVGPPENPTGVPPEPES